MKQYEKMIKSVCEVDWRRPDIPREEREGCIGVAICCAYIFSNIRANVSDMSKHLNLRPDIVEPPFRRLLINGVFSSAYDCKNDQVLLGDDSVDPMKAKRAWCVLAGISSELTGLV